MHVVCNLVALRVWCRFVDGKGLVVRELGVKPDQEVVVVEEGDGLFGRGARRQSGDVMKRRCSVQSWSQSACAPGDTNSITGTHRTCSQVLIETAICRTPSFRYCFDWLLLSRAP